MSQNIHILVVDDDKEIRQLLARYLSEHNFKTSIAKDGDEMMQRLEVESIDLIVLDVMLPGEDGISLCKKVRSTAKIPIIMLTAVDSETDKIIGLEVGADDYITKPFNPRELLARIKAVWRRFSDDESSSSHVNLQSGRILSFNGWSVNTVKRQLLSADGVEISLSSGEYDLLLIFLRNPQTVLSRDQLLDMTKNREAGPYDRSIDMQISRLRQKLEENPRQPQLIKTIRNGGYILAAEVESK